MHPRTHGASDRARALAAAASKVYLGVLLAGFHGASNARGHNLPGDGLCPVVAVHDDFLNIQRIAYVLRWDACGLPPPVKCDTGEARRAITPAGSIFRQV
ncbi:MAG: hypothetical protein LBU75_00935 [Desulfovibrio sp.]|jgi:hypothetical protein|nr:hypothetical protein [Desulfovibrio sp.]